MIVICSLLLYQESNINTNCVLPSAVFGFQIIGGFTRAVLGNQGVIVRTSDKENICNKNVQTVNVAPHKEIPFVFLKALMWVVSKFIAIATYVTSSFRLQRISAYSVAKIGCALAIWLYLYPLTVHLTTLSVCHTL
jgi:hypothetical protein